MTDKHHRLRENCLSGVLSNRSMLYANRTNGAGVARLRWIAGNVGQTEFWRIRLRLRLLHSAYPAGACARPRPTP